MKKFVLILSGILLSCWTCGQTIQNGQNGSNFISIDQISHDEQALGHQDHPYNTNTLLETYHQEIWVIEFTSDSTFVITETTEDIAKTDDNEIIIPKAMITKAVLEGMIEAYKSDSAGTSVDLLESKLGQSIHQISQSRNMDMLLYTEYKLLENMVKTSDITIISNEKEFYKELDNMVSGILVNVVFKPEEEIQPTLQERLEGMQIRQGAINSGVTDYLFRTQIGN